MTPFKPFFILRPGSGLCNRMQALASGIELAKKLNRRCIIIWLITNDLNARFEDLFEPLQSKRMITLRLGTKTFAIINYILRRIFYYVDDFLPDGTIVGAYYERWENSYRKNQSIYIASGENITKTKSGFEIFKVASSVLAMNDIDTEGFIGIHIRRTDNLWSVEQSPTYMFEEAIVKTLKLDKSQKFYLATDDPTEEEYLLRKFPSNIFIRKKESYKRDSVQGMQDAVLDLYNLSKCRKILGSYRSSFSTVASLWGARNLEIISKKQI